ncbi:cytochrome b6-f complex iron-sulfur subunit [Thermodesulfovibrio aggregans]|uniref:Cytochrome b6-f complex iron-sulfur subunit n=1 Tax=Thermodesulfovibrio aggregans TaxID=86166 RepID=A0A0U9HPL2_9BACT|nr:ubiquinol-cytochrome c reductase iron-sulfur subunit [Thermodesulfovibrio aggregans]GAQ95022.1 cytochrome b6-f complex iron-sulfur subunit [Thermodesulfovibrio aggregans]
MKKIKPENDSLGNQKRRLFLKKIINFLFLITGFMFVIVSLVSLKPKNPKNRAYKFFEIAQDKIPKEGVRKIDIVIEKEKSLKIFLVKQENSIIALSPVCTHLGCLVNFDRTMNEFVCPCHGGRYDIQGRVIKGPPKENLHRLPVKIENGKIFIGIKI